MKKVKPKKHKNAKLVPEGERCCPICGELMETETKNNISIDACPEHGVWLDKGELSKILVRAKSRLRQTHSANLRQAKRDGKMSGSMFGFWSLLYD